MSLEKIEELTSLTQEEEEMGVSVKQKATEIYKVSKEVGAFNHFENATKLGLTIGLKDIPFERAMLFTWIKETKDSGRKARV